MNALRYFILSVVLALTFTVPAHATDSQSIYLKNCAPCHGPDGKAGTPAGKKLHAKDLTESKLVDADVEKQITDGTKDAKGIRRMPSFKATLSGDDIAGLVAFVKTLRR